MTYNIEEELCNRCLDCVAACPAGAMLVGGRGIWEASRVLRSFGTEMPSIDQGMCDGCEVRMVPSCVAVCEAGAIHVNMLV